MTAMPDESFEKLEVWQRSLEIAVRLHELLRDCRDFGFRQQITDSADSISALAAAMSSERDPSWSRAKFWAAFSRLWRADS